MSDLYSFEDWKEEKRQDPDFVDASRDMELSYQLARLRIMRGLTQDELAARLNTQQSSISRLESGRSKPRLGFLERVVDALGGVLKIQIQPVEEVTTSGAQETSAVENVEYLLQVDNWPTGQGMEVDNESGDVSNDLEVRVSQ